jgi:hypothetical protein
VFSKGDRIGQMVFDILINNKKKKVKLSHYMPWRHLGGEEV